MKEKILVVEDDPHARAALWEILKKDYAVTTLEDGEKAVEAMKKDNFTIIITDMKLPGMNGMQVLKKAREVTPDSVLIVITGYGTIEGAVQAMKKGAYHYLTKPFRIDDILLEVERALEYYHLKRENSHLRDEVQRHYAFDNIIGQSVPMQDIYEVIRRVSDSDSTILLLGESGTGKELIARTIHYNSQRSRFPFVPVNCGAIPSELIESELFGHEKGSFTGAIAARQGRFEKANRGTIFLDEIGEMALHLQIRLLRVLQEREFERVGGSRTIQVDVRVIAATNRDLEDAVEQGRFRSDLYYRLNVIPIVIPPLRERKGDIPLLVNSFLKVMAGKKKRQIKGISDEAMDILANYSWPGNIRELENIIERMVILKQRPGPIVPDDIPPKIKGLKGTTQMAFDIPKNGIDLTKTVDELEREFIEKALNKVGGVKSKAAALLGINRTTLIEKMKKKGMLLASSKVKELH